MSESVMKETHELYLQYGCAICVSSINEEKTNKGLFEKTKIETSKEIKAAKKVYGKHPSENVKAFWNYVQSKSDDILQGG